MATWSVVTNNNLSRGTSWKAYDPTKPRRAPYISDEEWAKHKAVIQQIHESGKSRVEMLLILKSEHAFHPSMGQLVLRLAKWNLFVNTRPFARSTADLSMDLAEDRSSHVDQSSEEQESQVTLDIVPENGRIARSRSNSPIVVPDGKWIDSGISEELLPTKPSAIEAANSLQPMSPAWLHTGQDLESIQNTYQSRQVSIEHSFLSTQTRRWQHSVCLLAKTFDVAVDTILKYHKELLTVGNQHWYLRAPLSQLTRLEKFLARSHAASFSDVVRLMTPALTNIAVLADVLVLCGQGSDSPLAHEIYRMLGSCFERMQEVFRQDAEYQNNDTCFYEASGAASSPSLLAGWINAPLYFEEKQMLKVHIDHLQGCQHLSRFIASIRSWVICVLLFRGNSIPLTHTQEHAGVRLSDTEQRQNSFTGSLFQLLALLFNAWDQESNLDFVKKHEHGCESCGTLFTGYSAWAKRFILLIIVAAAKFHINKYSNDLIALVESELVKTISFPDSEQWIRLASSLRIDARTNTFSQSNRHIFSLVEISERELKILMGIVGDTPTSMTRVYFLAHWKGLQQAEIKLMKIMVQGDLPRALVFDKIRAYKKMELQLKLPHREREVEYRKLQPDDLPYMLDAILISMTSPRKDADNVDKMSLFSISTEKPSFRSFERFASQVRALSSKKSSLRSVGMSIESSSSWSFGRVTGYNTVTRSSSFASSSLHSSNDAMEVDPT